MSADGAQAPEVTVGVPVFNGEKYIRRTLEGLRDQSLPNIEIVVADNASTDSTREIVQEFVDADPRFRLLTADRNRGVPWNFNRLVDVARAPFFMWNASDDVVRARHLELCRDALLEHPEATIAFSRVVLIGPDDSVVGEMDDDGLDFLAKTPSERVALFFRRHVYQVIGFGGVFRTDVLRDMGSHPARYGGDLVLAVRMAMRRPWVQVQQQLFESRRHDDQTNKTQGGDVLDQVRVYDPTWRRPVAFPQWSLNAAFIRETIAAPVSASERLRATAAVIRLWTIPNWRFLPFDVKRNVVRLTHGRYIGAYQTRAAESAAS
jgi:glycosyltransferase involved in cell wall biosynthesis